MLFLCIVSINPHNSPRRHCYPILQMENLRLEMSLAQGHTVYVWWNQFLNLGPTGSKICACCYFQKVTHMAKMVTECQEFPVFLNSDWFQMFMIIA